VSRVLAYAFGWVAVAAVVLPAISSEPRASYPLSNYPMFSKKRENPILHKLVGISSSSGISGTNRVALPPSLVVEGSEVMQAVSTISQSVTAGLPAMQRLCNDVALRAAQDPRWVALERVELVEVPFDPVAYFTLGAQQLLMSCEVPHRAYGLQFLCLEFFFRGFLLFALARTIGAFSIFVMIVPYAMIHFGKPPAECVGSVIAGVALGTIALRTRSIYGGVFVHCGVAFSMDVFVLIQKGTFQRLLAS